MSYIQLFLSFLQIGAFSFGGGYAAMPLIQNQVVTLHHWLTAGEFNDLVTISQMTPGPIAVNSATFVGLRIAGLPGAAMLPRLPCGPTTSMTRRFMKKGLKRLMRPSERKKVFPWNTPFMEVITIRRLMSL